jgi:hypothetical protein
MISSAEVGALSDARIVSATEEINQISDDIQEALAHTDAGPAHAEPLAGVATSTNAEAASLGVAMSELPKTRVPVPKVVAVDLSSDAPDGVQWRGEDDALAGRREKGAFVSVLLALGYRAGEFRVTVRCVSPEGPDDSRQRYTVVVAQLRNGAPCRDKRFDGGHGADWVDKFARDAAIDFPRDTDPAAASARMDLH